MNQEKHLKKALVIGTVVVTVGCVGGLCVVAYRFGYIDGAASVVTKTIKDGTKGFVKVTTF